jgi:glycosyltransferase 2 family protein
MAEPTAQRKRASQIGRWLVRLIGPLLLVFFLWRSDPATLMRNLQGLTLWPLWLSLALMPVFIIVKSWRWNLAMRELGLQPPPLTFSMALYTIGLYAGGITPGQSGDFIKGWYLRDRGLPLAPALFSIVLDRLFDFAIMALLAVIGLVALVDVFPIAMQAPLRSATYAFAAVIFALTPLLMAKRPREWMLGLAERLVPLRFRALFARIREQFAPLDLRPGPLVGLMGFSVLSAISTVFRVGILYWTMPLGNIPWVAIIGSTAVIAILQALPISFAGVGVRDAVLIALLQYYGHTPEQALLLSVQFLIINIEHILVGFLVSLRYPLAVGAKPEEAR